MCPTGKPTWLVAAMLMPAVSILAASALAGSMPASAEESACAKIQAVPGASGYQIREKDSRCEGFYQSPVAGASLELLSLTAGSVSYKLEANNTLYIVAPNVSALNSARLQVRARALPLGTYYRMDTTIPSSGSMNWPMAAVLAAAKLTDDTIGIVGWVERDSNIIFVPLAASDRNRPPSTGPSIIAILRSSVDLDEFRWRSSLDGGTSPPAPWKRLERNPVALRAGGPILLELEPGKGGRRVEVAAKVINSDRWLSLNLRMFEP